MPNHMFKVGQIFSKLKNSLKASLTKSANKIHDGLTEIFFNKKLDDNTLQELEDLLISTDMGHVAATAIVDQTAKLKFKQNISLQEIKSKISDEIIKILKPVEEDFKAPENSIKTHIIMLCGVNGNGKTTSIGKLAYKFKEEGKTVMIAACDTFRAAANEQLEIWANRAGSIFLGSDNIKDPASVAYKAIKEAHEKNIEVLFIDTAGRLHTQKNLMDELKKINNIIYKLNDGASHHVILALDATTGQNALHQIKIFKEMVNIDGLIITKLDGTAKGGIIINIAKNYPELKIYFIGTGEKIEDLMPFNSQKFAENLLGLEAIINNN